MRKSRFTETQIVSILKEAESGLSNGLFRRIDSRFMLCSFHAIARLNKYRFYPTAKQVEELNKSFGHAHLFGIRYVHRVEQHMIEA